MGNIFFWIARSFSMLIATCALIAALWTVILGLSQTLSPNKTAELPTTPTFSAYVDTIGQKGAPAAADDSSADAKSQADEISKRFFAHRDKITSNLNAYGNAIGIGEINKPVFNNALMQLLSNDDTATVEDYMSQLEKFSGEMPAQAPAIKKAAAHDFQKATYGPIIEWFDAAYRQEGKDYQANIDAAEAANAAKGIQARWNLIAAAVFFGIFIAFTMLLVLLQVERNTRPRTYPS